MIFSLQNSPLSLSSSPSLFWDKCPLSFNCAWTLTFPSLPVSGQWWCHSLRRVHTWTRFTDTKSSAFEKTTYFFWKSEQCIDHWFKPDMSTHWHTQTYSNISPPKKCCYHGCKELVDRREFPKRIWAPHLELILNTVTVQTCFSFHCFSVTPNHLMSN